MKVASPALSPANGQDTEINEAPAKKATTAETGESSRVPAA